MCIRDRIWKPLEVALDGVTRINLAPDGKLNTIPIGIIPMPDGKLLMERYDLRLVSSTKDLLKRGPVAGNGPAAKAALLIGNPLFDLSAREQLAVEHTLESTLANVSQAASAPPDAIDVYKRQHITSTLPLDAPESCGSKVEGSSRHPQFPKEGGQNPVPCRICTIYSGFRVLICRQSGRH